MLASEMIARLQRLVETRGDLEVTILDGFNGGGDPRTVNLGPAVRDLDDPHVRLDCDDINTQHGHVIVMAFGCY